MDMVPDCPEPLSLQRCTSGESACSHDLEPPEDSRDYQAWTRFEQAVASRVKDLAVELAEAAQYIWVWGDGAGGQVMRYLEEAFDERGLGRGHTTPTSGPRRGKIQGSLRKRVYERDLYRCIACGTHLDLTCDHIIPEAKGGPTTFENLQTLCMPCNAKKHLKSNAEFMLTVGNHGTTEYKRDGSEA